MTIRRWTQVVWWTIFVLTITIGLGIMAARPGPVPRGQWDACVAALNDQDDIDALIGRALRQPVTRQVDRTPEQLRVARIDHTAACRGTA